MVLALLAKCSRRCDAQILRSTFTGPPASLIHFSDYSILVRAPTRLGQQSREPLQQRRRFPGPRRELKKTLARFTLRNDILRRECRIHLALKWFSRLSIQTPPPRTVSAWPLFAGRAA